VSLGRIGDWETSTGECQCGQLRLPSGIKGAAMVDQLRGTLSVLQAEFDAAQEMALRDVAD
jgi:hypothetical protein